MISAAEQRAAEAKERQEVLKAEAAAASGAVKATAGRCPRTLQRGVRG
ncbi:hypothetical protein [Verrucomicrobium spinosum]|nr:hypothetical protein [Verrucomicrobium spinosum]